ncbi:hypothetical protein V8E54_005899 [Elaphomyces granulatus]
MSPTTPSRQIPMNLDSSKREEPGSSHILLRPKPDGQSEQTRSHKLPNRPSLPEASILSSTSSPAPPLDPTLDVTEGPKFSSMSLTKANLTRHHHHISLRFRDPLVLQLTLQERSAQIEDAIRSFDTGDLLLPDSIVKRVAATSEGLLPMERSYGIGSYHREPQGESVTLQSKVGGSTERMKTRPTTVRLDIAGGPVLCMQRAIIF